MKENKAIKLTIKEEVTLPHTNIILEKGDIIEVIPKENKKNHIKQKTESKVSAITRMKINRRLRAKAILE